MLENLQSKNVILASKSPRRQQLLKALEIDFEVRGKDVDESFPKDLKKEEIPLYLARTKADAFRDELKENDVLITADTVVWINDHVLNKPENYDEAVAMLTELSGKEHWVYTGVCITQLNKQVVFSDATKVVFAVLTPAEIDHYITTYKPYDKAGAYGAQDWIGVVAIRQLQGSYFNVMGLPVDILYRELKEI